MMKRKRICALLLAAALLVGAAGCMVQEPAPGEPEQTGYVMDEGFLTMTVDWMVDTRDRRSERFESAVFAGDLVDVWATQLVDEITLYQKTALTVKNADPEETSELAQHDLIVLSDGLLALLSGTSASEYAGAVEARLYELLDAAKENAVIVLTSLPYLAQGALGTVPAERVLEYNAALRAVAMGANVLYADLYRAQSQTVWSQAADGMSLGTIGNLLATGEVLQTLMRACTCLCQDGANPLTTSAISAAAPTEAALQAFREAATAEELEKALQEAHLGVSLSLYKSMDTEGRAQTVETLLAADRSIAENYMLADLLVNLAASETLGERTPMERAETGLQTYVAVGDSITEGCMAIHARTDSWVAHLSELISAAQGFELNTTNRGIGGTKMCTEHQHFPAAKDTVQQYIVPLKPDLVTVAYGINDFHAGTTLDTFLTDYRAYLEELTDSCPDAVVIVCGLCCKGNDQDSTRVREWNKALRELVEEFGLIYCETYDDMYGVNWILADGLHPNNAGYRMIASTVFRVLNENVNLSEKSD